MPEKPGTGGLTKAMHYVKQKAVALQAESRPVRRTIFTVVTQRQTYFEVKRPTWRLILRTFISFREIGFGISQQSCQRASSCNHKSYSLHRCPSRLWALLIALQGPTHTVPVYPRDASSTLLHLSLLRFELFSHFPLRKPAPPQQNT